MANVPAPLTKAMDAVRGFSLAQRTIALIGVAVLVLGIIALAAFMSQPKLTPLYTGLAPEDAAGIVEQLKTDSIPYELTGGGGTILVPEANVYESRLKAASAGLPSAGTSGYSLLDDMGVTSSEFQQSITYKRALEGELATTIQAMDGINLASVKLAIPEETVFVDSKTDPTASIFVETKPNAALGSDQVQSIVHLTSAAVDGLKAENVSVVDSTGKLLSAAGVGVTGGAEKQTTDYETRVAGVIQAMLDRVVGPGNATVAVAADLSLESAERTEESFTNPEGNPALTESSKEEEYEGTGGAGAGVLGPDNIAVPGGNGGEGTFTSTDSQRTNAVNKVTENRLIPSGTLNRQSVSVALDSAATQELNIADITEMVGTAAGIDEARNDTVSVSVVPFNADGAAAAQQALDAAAAAELAARNAELQKNLIIGGVIGLALVLLTVYALYIRRNKQNREPVDLGEFRDFAPLPPAPAPVVHPETTAITKVPLPEPVAALVTPQHIKRDELSALAASDPAKMADYLRTVMDDRKVQ
ncbi:flagellar basal-body MS-ring/collar protein FliF [Paeniglutamicibacter psychrophenolicus]|uniref:flagellar basal-body MS-ring/collar protein FliF n=1 Tax=Paeniglutamicibacter psychrophenolicus TaxID=257454 RepID=UPI002780BCA6|nr:flagellar basal-body MS-ring/collar protein FliF [Paeniglutamicibacter psychrophenolicus]MDQ0094644.1 flagellar M-ring protein FliF [Paeniglutamicibacter psychrophenolicus]